jgi:hypothetical protein
MAGRGVDRRSQPDASGVNGPYAKEHAWHSR